MKTIALLLAIFSVHAQAGYSIRQTPIVIAIGGEQANAMLVFSAATTVERYANETIATLAEPRIVMNGKTYFIAPDNQFNQIGRWLCEQLYRHNDFGAVRAVYPTNFEQAMLWDKGKILVKTAANVLARVNNKNENSQRFYINTLACNVVY